MNFGCEDFYQRRKKKRPFVLKLIDLLSKQGNVKMLTLNDFPKGLKDGCPESILLQILFSSRLMKFLKIFAAFTVR